MGMITNFALLINWKTLKYGALAIAIGVLYGWHVWTVKTEVSKALEGYVLLTELKAAESQRDAANRLNEFLVSKAKENKALREAYGEVTQQFAELQVKSRLDAQDFEEEIDDLLSQDNRRVPDVGDDLYSRLRNASR